MPKIFFAIVGNELKAVQTKSRWGHTGLDFLIYYFSSKSEAKMVRICIGLKSDR